MKLLFPISFLLEEDSCFSMKRICNPLIPLLQHFSTIPDIFGFP